MLCPAPVKRAVLLEPALPPALSVLAEDGAWPSVPLVNQALLERHLEELARSGIKEVIYLRRDSGLPAADLEAHQAFDRSDPRVAVFNGQTAITPGAPGAPGGSLIDAATAPTWDARLFASLDAPPPGEGTSIMSPGLMTHSARMPSAARPWWVGRTLAMPVISRTVDSKLFQERLPA